MNKILMYKIAICLGVLLLLAEILFLDFDDLRGSLTLKNILSISIPLLLTFGFWLGLKKVKEEDRN